MRKRLPLFIALLGWSLTAQAADLIEVYKKAQNCDPVFLQAVAQRLSTKEGVPIAAAAILPNLNLYGGPYISRTWYSGSNYTVSSDGLAGLVNARNLTQRGYNYTLSLSQTIFNFAQFNTVASQVELSRGADATLNAALQSLMTRVSAAYFKILFDEDNLRFTEANKRAYAEQLEQSRLQYKVGLKTMTDVYTADAAYNSSVAQSIEAETQLAKDRENLRAITGVYYPHLSSLSEAYPMLKPDPMNEEKWVTTAQLQNWTIKASQANTESARYIIKQQYSGHLPTVSVEGAYTKQFNDNISGYDSFIARNGPGTTASRSVSLNVNVPLFSGGGVVAQTNQAIYNYQAAQQQLEQAVRDTLNQARQSYLSVISSISQVSADKLAIKSAISSLNGVRASYRVGTETLVNVLTQQQKVLQAQRQYALDRYAYVNNMLSLKQAAGILSFEDLVCLNSWLIK